MGFHRELGDNAGYVMSPPRFVVVDVETTGVYNADRVVEIAAVTVSPYGEILDEWDTLVNPERDVGPTHIHGITASMVSAAPRFEEAASALAERLHGAVLVGHNLPFDARMLVGEYGRLGADLNPGVGFCTMAHCRGSLEVACARYGIGLTYHHRALADARATAQLFFASVRGSIQCAPATLYGFSSATVPRTLRRDAFGRTEHQMPYLARLAAGVCHYRECGAHLMYLDMLDRALDDLAVSAREWADLSSLAAGLGMTTIDMQSCHECYLHELVAAATRDGRVTDEEYRLLQRVTCALGLDIPQLEEMVSHWRRPPRVVCLEPGMNVCFTGAATYSDGSELNRDHLAGFARSLGLGVVDSVTKKTCQVLVAADVSSASGKARRARDYGIPIVSVEDFLCATAGAAMPVS